MVLRVAGSSPVSHPKTPSQGGVFYYHTMTINAIAILLTGSALTGWFVYRLLIWLLFHPARPISLAGIRFQGLVPGFRPVLAEKLGDWIQSKAIPQLNLQEKISNPSNIEKLLPLIEGHIDEFLQHKLSKEMPMISMFIGEKTIGKLKETFLNEIASMLPKLLQSYAQNMEQQLDVRPFIQKIMNEYPDAVLKNLLIRSFAKEIRMGGLLAALAGLAIGTIELIIFLTL